jgi:hypothetical protein
MRQEKQYPDRVAKHTVRNPEGLEHPYTVHVCVIRILLRRLLRRPVGGDS